MPAADADLQDDPQPEEPISRLPFAPVTQSHILHCSVHFWHPLFRTLTPKTRLVPLSDSFIDYLRADGIMLPPEERRGAPTDRFSDDSEDEEEAEIDPSAEWPDVHGRVCSTIRELGGSVHPKLNWSAPKDATWISATNTMHCVTANDVYVLLKSSDFVSHDLEQAFDGCTTDTEGPATVPYHLVLRKSIASIVTSMEFRCFVKDRTIIGVCQRDLNHYDFLPSLLPVLERLILDFFEKLKSKFPDPNFVFDVYIPQPNERGRVWLIDINPWAPRTDPLLFSWMELLTNSSSTQSLQEGNGSATGDDAEEISSIPEFRIVKRDDPEAYSFNTPLYSAHKLPKDVVDAGLGGNGGIREFLDRWNQLQVDLDADEGDESE